MLTTKIRVSSLVDRFYTRYFGRRIKKSDRLISVSAPNKPGSQSLFLSLAGKRMKRNMKTTTKITIYFYKTDFDTG